MPMPLRVLLSPLAVLLVVSRRARCSEVFKVCILVFGVVLLGCESTRALQSTTVGALKLSRVVLYRNGVAYFERAGVVDGDRLTIKARKDQINDFLKSLTVIDRSSGKPRHHSLRG